MIYKELAFVYIVEGKKFLNEKQAEKFLKGEPTHECSVCSSEVEEEGIIGEFGILPVQFCCWCYSSITDMVMQLNKEE